MALNKVMICGVNTSKLPLLTDEEKEALFVRIADGDMDAREKFIKGNLRLVLSVIQRFSGNNMESADDLFQVGCIGLIKAIDNFDRSLDVKFSTYAVPMIIGECRRYLRDNNAIRVSRSLRDIAYKAIYAKDILTKRMDREPTIEEISNEIDIPKATNANIVLLLIRNFLIPGMYADLGRVRKDHCRHGCGTFPRMLQRRRCEDILWQKMTSKQLLYYTPSASFCKLSNFTIFE